MPHTAYADVARLTRLAQHFATEAVQAGDVAAFPPPAALAELPAVELRRLLDGLLTIRPPRPIPDDDIRADLDEMLAAEAAQRVLEAGAPDASALPTLSLTHDVDGPVGERVALWKGDLTTGASTAPPPVGLRYTQARMSSSSVAAPPGWHMPCPSSASPRER